MRALPDAPRVEAMVAAAPGAVSAAIVVLVPVLARAQHARAAVAPAVATESPQVASPVRAAQARTAPAMRGAAAATAEAEMARARVARTGMHLEASDALLPARVTTDVMIDVPALLPVANDVARGPHVMSAAPRAGHANAATGMSAATVVAPVGRAVNVARTRAFRALRTRSAMTVPRFPRRSPDASSVARSPVS